MFLVICYEMVSSYPLTSLLKLQPIIEHILCNMVDLFMHKPTVTIHTDTKDVYCKLTLGLLISSSGILPHLTR
jgi:hypothetical protein